MPWIVLPVALIATLGGLFALAFRVVPAPSGKRGARPATTGAKARKSAPREPTQALLDHMTDEYKRHTLALREARDLRRARSEAEALARLLRERVTVMETARSLGRWTQPAFGGRVRQWIDQTRLELMIDTVRREVAEAHMPSVRSQPLAGERVVSRVITWARGGPQTGAAHMLVEYHRQQRGHYRRELTAARRIAQAGDMQAAQRAFDAEQMELVRMSQTLKSDLLALGGDNRPPAPPTRRLAPLA
ncbi:MAG: hypothetical protein KGO05_11335 [Chloroflexota bacterium]|nr:hypothetical protein [Chloroflexota bacterium]